MQVCPCKFYDKIFVGFRKNNTFLKILLTADLDRFTPSQDVPPILLLDGSVMITNEASIAFKCFE